MVDKNMLGIDEYNEFGLIRAGVILAVFTFIVIITYFALSMPINAIYSGFENADFGNAEDEITSYMPIIRNVTTLFFAIFVSLPVTWFFFWVFHREPSYNPSSFNQWRR
jgi:hypothetical protein